MMFTAKYHNSVYLDLVILDDFNQTIILVDKDLVKI